MITKLLTLTFVLSAFAMQGCSSKYRINDPFFNREDYRDLTNRKIKGAESLVREGKSWLAYPLLTDVQKESVASEAQKERAVELLQGHQDEVDAHLQEVWRTDVAPLAAAHQYKAAVIAAERLLRVYPTTDLKDLLRALHAETAQYYASLSGTPLAAYFHSQLSTWLCGAQPGAPWTFRLVPDLAAGAGSECLAKTFSGESSAYPPVRFTGNLTCEKRVTFEDRDKRGMTFAVETKTVRMNVAVPCTTHEGVGKQMVINTNRNINNGMNYWTGGSGTVERITTRMESQMVTVTHIDTSYYPMTRTVRTFIVRIHGTLQPDVPDRVGCQVDFTDSLAQERISSPYPADVKEYAGATIDEFASAVAAKAVGTALNRELDTIMGIRAADALTAFLDAQQSGGEEIRIRNSAIEAVSCRANTDAPALDSWFQSHYGIGAPVAAGLLHGSTGGLNTYSQEGDRRSPWEVEQRYYQLRPIPRPGTLIGAAAVVGLVAGGILISKNIKTTDKNKDESSYGNIEITIP